MIKEITKKKKSQQRCSKKNVIPNVKKIKKSEPSKKLQVDEVKNESVAESPPKKRRRKKSKDITKMYFTQDTEDAIIAYNQEEDIEIREQIFKDKILYPFQKLVENIFNTFKFSYFETGPQDAQRECLTHLVANMHKFDPARSSKTDPNKKTKAYSFFSIVAKHYLILLNNTNYKKFNQNIEISEERTENTVQLHADDKYYAQQEMSDFIKLIIQFWENNLEKIFTKQRDLNIANAVIELFRNSNRIDAFNKKALYLYIREMAMCKTQQITKVINRMKQYHESLHRSYIEYGNINTEHYTMI